LGFLRSGDRYTESPRVGIAKTLSRCSHLHHSFRLNLLRILSQQLDLKKPAVHFLEPHLPDLL
jgi:hypothetical protein